MSTTYDFILIVGGVAGCIPAHKLAEASSQRSVLLLEAGGAPAGETLLPPYDRYTPAFTRPDLDYGYKTMAQSKLNDCIIPYLRGKRPRRKQRREFYDLPLRFKRRLQPWAELAGDESWDWEQL